MRATLRLLAAARPAARYLEAGAPTGLTGLATHASPRSTLLYLYSSTLEKLKAVPEHSLYRQSVEALTQHRMALVEEVVPPGYDEWHERAKKLLDEHPDQFTVASGTSVKGAAAFKVERNGETFVVRHIPPEEDMRYQEWDGELDEGPVREDSRTAEEKEYLQRMSERRDPADVERAESDPELQLTAEEKEYLQHMPKRPDPADVEHVELEPEPQLTADQISELENKIGAGLIEEVIQVAEGELRLVDTMIQSKVWEPLEEQPAEGQWVYFERKP
ncbi:11578874-0779-4d8b-b26c-e6ec27f8529a [Thermothielavioides terrestris]|uniref:11578874-0779-4d8b-b26c-e6ec27f8529a n=1 Tax=Thermothielavioides terrestris TaxID=2587410 RepID=A0A446BMK4_9PEZI|nr:11578874-0779-4d8b-b26c-e6ec27f8529a [Thermothielavioides terrestris]